MINIVVTSKPVLMDYYIIVMNIVTCLTKLASTPQIVIVRHRDYNLLKYIDAIKNKYTYYDSCVYRHLCSHSKMMTLMLDEVR